MKGWQRGGRSELDEREEVLAHVRIEADRLMQEGLDEGEAMRRARARFGVHPDLNPADLRRRLSPLEELRHALRIAIRQLRSAPLSTMTVLISLVIGIGANTAILSLADQVLLRPLPIDEPEAVVQLRWEGRFIGEGRGWGSLLPHPLYVELADQNPDVFTQVAARSPGTATVTTPAGAERGTIALVTGDFFSLMRVRPHLGRFLDEGDDQVLGGHPVVVLSHAFWETRFGADSTVIGRQMGLNGQPMTVVGVAPPDFQGTDWSNVPVAWTSMMMNGLIHEWGRLDEPRIRFQHVFARLAPGTTREEAEAALQPWFRRYIEVDRRRADWPGDLTDTDVSSYLTSRLAVDPGGQGDASRVAALTEPVVILSAATALLLLLACLNVANLSLARALTRHRDTAVRVALGASRRRIVAERLLEAGLLAMVGGGAGVLLSPLIGRWTLEYLRIGGGDMALSASVDARALALAFVIGTIVTLLSGAAPAWVASETRPMSVIRTRTVGGGIRLRRALVVGQVALALVLLMGAGLFGATLKELRGGGPGFDPEQLVTFTVNPGADGYSPTEARLLNAAVLEAVEGTPGVESAGMSAWALLEGGGWGNSMLVEGDERFVTDLYLPMNAVTPGFFDVLGVDVIRGRDFGPQDRSAADEWRWDRVIVSESFVERYLPGRDPLGVRIDFGRDPSAAARMEIIGVVADYAEQSLRDPAPQVYFPYWAQLRTRGVAYLRTRAPLSVIAPELRRRISGLDGSLIVEDLRSVDEQIDRLLVVERMLSAFGAAFALFGAILAMIGIYGVLSYAVQARSREMGIRLALGAPARSASALLVRDAAVLTLIGITCALPVLWFAAPLLEAQLVGVSARNPFGLLIAAAAILVVCLAASAGPAIRMGRVDPMQVFRVE